MMVAFGAVGQPGNPPPDPGNPVPISGIEILLGLGALLGIRRYWVSSKKGEH